MPTPQQQINYGNTANDGQGDPLRTAFIKVDDNFDAVWAAGPVGSNVTILNNTVGTVTANGNLIITANGVGVIQTNSSLVPRFDNTSDLGSANLRYRSLRVGTGGATISGNVTAGTILTDSYLYANGAPFSPGSDYGNSDVADFLANGFGSNNITTTGNISASVINSPSLAWPTPLTIQTNGNAWTFADQVFRSPTQGSWTGAVDTEFLNSNPNGYINLQAFQNGNLVSKVEVEHSFIRLRALNGQDCSWQFNCSGVTSFPNYSFPYLDGNAGEVLKTDGSGTLYWDADLTDYGNANVLALGESGWTGNIMPAANLTYSLGNSDRQWQELWVGNSTIYIGGVALSITGNTLTVAGEPVLSNDSDTDITTTGNITANYFFGNGSQLTGLPAGYTDANVSTFLAAFGSNSISTTGNITATRLQNDANLVIRSNVAGTARTWTFDTLGDLNLPVGGNITGSGGISANNITLTGNITANTAGFAIGYRDIPQVSFTANVTMTAADAGKHFYSTESTDYILTIANNASQTFQTGAAITVINQGTGNITVAQGSGVTLYLAGNATSGNRTVSTYGMATIMKVATDTWFINGTGVA